MSVNNISGWWWWWWRSLLVQSCKQLMAGCCVWMIYSVQPRTALTALKWSRQVHGILSWKHFFTDVIIPPVSSSNHPRCVGNGVVQWSRTKPFSSLWMLSFVCAARVPSCIQSDKALKYFRMTVYFVKVSLRRILTGCTEFLSMLHLSWMNDVSYHYFFEAVASFSCGVSFVPFTSGCLEIWTEKINLL